MKYKLIVSDLDGTLLCSDGRISEETERLVRMFIQEGGYFTIATGRMEDAVKPFVEYLNIQVPAIFYNGSKIVDIKKDTTIYETFLDYELARTALLLLKNYEWDVLLYQNQKMYVEEITPGIKKHLKKECVACEAVGDLYDFLKEAPTKILIIGNSDKFDVFVDELRRTAASDVNTTLSESTYLEILPQRASKGEALKILAGELDVAMNEVIAIGDHLNDLSMIKAAGLGIAMKNAHPELRKNAAYITASNDEGGVNEVICKVMNDKDFNHIG